MPHFHDDTDAFTMIRRGFELVLAGLEKTGLDISGENFTDTPSRVAKSYLEMLDGIDRSKIADIFEKTFATSYSGMVVVDEIDCFSMCPHHFLPIKYKINFGYVPYKRVLGLSKIARFIKLLARAPIIQEDLTDDIVNLFTNYIDPRGCMVTLEGLHMCMCARGVEMPNATTLTTAMRGVFEEDHVKQEFFDHLKLKKK